MASWGHRGAPIRRDGFGFGSLTEYRFALSWMARHGGKVHQTHEGYICRDRHFLRPHPLVRLTPSVSWRVDYLVRGPEPERKPLYYMEFKGVYDAGYRAKTLLWQDFGPLPLQVWSWHSAREQFLPHTLVPPGLYKIVDRVCDESPLPPQMQPEATSARKPKTQPKPKKPKPVPVVRFGEQQLGGNFLELLALLDGEAPLQEDEEP